MSSSHILIVANDVVPGMGMPVAAPGLRAWGIASGLRAHGYAVTLAVVERSVRLAWHQAMPPPLPADTFIGTPAQIGAFARTHRPFGVVVTNSNHVQSLGDLGRSKLIYDFFAPKMLELAHEVEGDGSHDRLATLQRRKLSALAQSDVVIVNGAKKLGYVHDWLSQAGKPEGSVPVEVINMPVPPRLLSRRPEGQIKAVVSGYIQSWSQPGPWLEAVRPILDSGQLHLDLLVMRHWGKRNGTNELPPGFQKLIEHDAVSTHGGMEFGDFQAFLAERDLSIDLFAYNSERELAMVTRTMVSLSSGLPVVHVPFTECSPLIERHDAGWLVDGDDVPSITRTIETIVHDIPDIVRKREGAQRMAQELLDPVVATRPLAKVLEDLR